MVTIMRLGTLREVRQPSGTSLADLKNVIIPHGRLCKLTDSRQLAGHFDCSRPPLFSILMTVAGRFGFLAK